MTKKLQSSLYESPSRSRGTPTPGSWPGVVGGNYSDMGVGEKCFDCAEEKGSCLEVTSQK